MKKSWIQTAIMAVALAVAGTAKAATIGQWLFDDTNTSTVTNSIAGGDTPTMAQFGVVTTNLHAAGGPFAPTFGTGMMRTPNSGNYGARDSSSVVDWTTKSQLTLEMWVNPSVYETGGHDALHYRGQILRLTGSGDGSTYRLTGYNYTGSIYTNTGLGTLSVTTGVWSHIALTYDGATMRTYVNGMLDKSVASVHTLGNSSADLFFAAFSPGVNQFHGLLDEIRVSDVALLPGDGSGKGVLAWNATLVPEPTATALLSLGGAMLFFRRRGR